MHCKFCQSKKLSIEYSGPIRSGGANSELEDGYQIISCKACGIRFLDPFPSMLDEYYSGKDYWENHHGQLSINMLQKKLDPEQFRWKSEIDPTYLRNKVVLDYGCGSGLFLDGITSIASQTIGVDKAGFFKDHLRQNGHIFYNELSSLKKGAIQTLVSFDTLEHLPEPLTFLKEIHNKLSSDADIFIGVPNYWDFLKKLVPKYLPFFYHKSHLYYYSEQCLKWMLDKTSFQHVDTSFVHKYNIENAINWALHFKGTGNKSSGIFDKFTEGAFRMNLERQGISSHILIHAKKK